MSVVQIQTKDGPCPTEIFATDASAAPAVILLHDAGGPRAAMSEIAERLAKRGSIVAVPDLFHRSGSIGKLLPPGATIDANVIRTIFGNPDTLKRFRAEFYGPALKYENLEATVGAVIDHLAPRSSVIATTGYCMGGNASLRVATIFGARIAATASFHGGHLASKDPESPHLRANAIRSRVYIAGAIEDDSFNDEAKATLDKALTDAHVKHTIETYPAKHGFCVRDNPSYDAASAERHYNELDTLIRATT